MKMRPPATPIFNIDPFFSVWTEESVLKNTVHWTGKPNTMHGRVFVDGTEYHFLGKNMWTCDDCREAVNMTVESTEIDAYSTVITYTNEFIRLTLHLTSPTLVDDLYYASRPVAYAKVAWESIDGRDHDVKVRFTVTEELVLNFKSESRALAEVVGIDGLTTVKMGNGEQKVLNRSGDDMRIDWGHMYVSVKGEGKIGQIVYDGMYAITLEADVKNEALFLFAYDDTYSIQYFGENLKAYWKHDGKTIESAIAEAAEDYSEVLARCNAFSDKLKSEATEKGGEKYAELLMLAIRQVMAAHKLVVDNDGNYLFISKECHSNGCAATVDVTYPSAPLFLLYNTELLKGMIRPVMRYAATDEWTFDFAPHDVGQYPLVNGQVYGVDRKGKVTIHEKYQMPVEECGNLIILFAAIAEADGSVDFAKDHIDTLRQWSRYLIKYGLDPENQLCTDDFAGHLAHNVNLSIKAIMGIAGFSRILEKIGEADEAAELMATARSYAASLIERATNSDGSYRLAYDKPETFSLKYNSVWDKLWGTGLFPDEFYKGEVERYKKEILPYGVPLDSREKYTKSDWLVWAATLADNKEDFNTIVESLWRAYDTMRTRAPMTDWYYADTSHMTGFRHRTVQGGLFIKLMFD
ncbi:MAG: DUF4965 domain-containing protein [Clostridia bacterium]|nr:DUF4965 domain-containing protein [Clostridia bacterium]